jgi:type IV secretion system protein VirB10
MSAQPCRRRCHPGASRQRQRQGGGWGNIALLGAGAALVGAIGGIAIGYATFHHPASSKAAEQPAKASDRAVADVMASPTRSAPLAGQLGQPNAPQPTSSAGPSPRHPASSQPM